jgi:hypothetical protein
MHGAEVDDGAIQRLTTRTKMKLFILGSACLFLAWADVESGPKAGDKVPALKAFGIVEQKEADFAKERKDAPTVYLFVAAEKDGIPTGGRPLARFMKKLDAEVGMIDGAKVTAIWLGEKAFDAHKEYLPRFQKSMQLEHTSLAAFDGGKSGPEEWGINADAHLTAVVAYKGKVVKSFAFVSLNETDVPQVVKELKAAGK